MSTTNTNIIISGAPIAYCLGVYWDDTTLQVSSGDAAYGDLTTDEYRLKFDNVKEVKIKKNISTSASAAAENIDIEAADSMITRFTKSVRTIDGTNEDTITDPTTDENATNEGSIELTVNEGDMDSAGWTAFLNKLETRKSDYFLIVVPVGLNYEKRYNVSTAWKADGWAFMLGKLNMDLEHVAGTTPSSITLIFESFKFVSTDTDYVASDEWAGFAATGSATSILSYAPTGIALKGTSPAISLIPEMISATNAENIHEGKVQLVEYS